MKNSVWYHKLWRKKLEKLPLEKDADSAWKAMRPILDQQLPQHHAPLAGTSSKPKSSLVRLLQFLVPAAVIIAAILYYVTRQPEAKKKQSPVQPKTEIEKKQPVTSERDTLLPGNADENSSSIAEPEAGRNPDSEVVKVNAQANDKINGETGHGNQQNDQPVLTGKSDKVKLPGHSKAAIITTRNKNSKRAEPRLLNPRMNDRETSSTSAQAGKRVERTISGNQTDETILPAGEPGSPGNRLNDSTHTSDTGTEQRQPGKVTGFPESYRDLVPLSFVTIFDGMKNNGLQPMVLLFDPQAVLDHDHASLQKSQDPAAVLPADSAGKADQAGKKQKNQERTLAYGLKFGWNTGSQSVFVGAYASLKITPRLFITPEVNLHTLRDISGSYTHASYFRPDTIPPFTVTNAGKLSAIDFPLNLEYALSENLRLKAGAFLTIPLKQATATGRISNLPDRRDTLGNGRLVDQALAGTAFDVKTGMGITAGASYTIHRLAIEARYLKNSSPYRISSSLGASEKKYQTLQIGVAFRLNKKRKTP